MLINGISDFIGADRVPDGDPDYEAVPCRVMDMNGARWGFVANDGTLEVDSDYDGDAADGDETSEIDIDSDGDAADDDGTFEVDIDSDGDADDDDGDPDNDDDESDDHLL
jgi:hypothetical protein